MMSIPDNCGQTRSHLPRQLIALVAVIASGVTGWLFLNRDITDQIPRFTGYVVSDNVYTSSPISGTVISVLIKRGQHIEAGTLLFQIDSTSLDARIEKIKAQIQAAESQNAVEQSLLDAAQAEQTYTTTDMNRFLSIMADHAGSVSKQDVDKSIQAAAKATASVAASRNRIAAAEAQINSYTADLRDMEKQVADLSPKSPVSGRIEEIMYKQGEWVAANTPIISIVPEHEVKIRFYVPQSQIHFYPTGTRVSFQFDGSPAGLTATVDFVSTRPEYTPPVIYSLDVREKLVFMVEAVPDDPKQVIPGQPIDVIPITIHHPGE